MIDVSDDFLIVNFISSVNLSLFHVLLFILLFGITTPVYASTPISEVRSLIDKHYVDPVEEDVLKEPTIDGILSHLDPYSVYFTDEEYEEFVNSINNLYVGIGARIEKVEDSIIITEVFPGSPADDAGILTGDQIYSIESILVKEESVEQVIGRISGAEGTSVNVTFYRSSTNQYLTKTLIRKKVSLPTVTTKKLAGNVGYMSVNSFNTETLSRMQEDLIQYSGVDHWIVDLRNNSGGYLSVAQQVVGMFPSADVVLLKEDRNQLTTVLPYKQRNQFLPGIGMLVNEYSASAAEVVAGALQDQQNATLYGSTTYGKGLIQSIFTVKSGGYLKLTTARYYTPSHRAIDGVGVVPDIETATPLIDAHNEWLMNEYNSYKVLPALSNIPPDKVFNINVSIDSDINTLRNKVELIKLGGGAIPISVSPRNGRYFEVTPEQELQIGEEYLLLVHPGWESTEGVPSKAGVIVQASVN